MLIFTSQLPGLTFGADRGIQLFLFTPYSSP